MSEEKIKERSYEGFDFKLKLMVRTINSVGLIIIYNFFGDVIQAYTLH